VSVQRRETPEAWPRLDYATLAPTAETLRLLTQVVGKVRLARTPWINHSWHVTFYLSARGLTTSLIPNGDAGIELEFDFVAHDLSVRASDGGERRIPLGEGSISDFYARALEALASLGAATRIDPTPNELTDPEPFPKDHAPRPYNGAAVRDFWRALVQIDRVFTRFRSRFIGKCSPVHFFWGSFDLAVTRFSGRRAPIHPGGIPHLPDDVVREAYSHELSSAGFWPGGEGVPEPCFYSYAWPSPPGFSIAAVSPAAARFDTALGEFLLPYEAVRSAPEPDEALLSFLQSTYEAAANLAHWDRAALECAEGRPGFPRPVS
jgi:hypothetical protein